jgi:hypothetical protein
MNPRVMASGRAAVVAIAVCALSSSHSQAAPRAAAFVLGENIPGLAAYWPLDVASGGTVADLSGNGNTGTLTNGASIVAPPAPAPAAPNANAGCLATAAASGQQYVLVPDAAPLEISGPITLAAWVYPTLNTGTGDATVAQKCIIEKWMGGGASINGYFLRLTSANTGNNTPLFSRGDGTAQTDAQAAGPLTLNTWTHLAGVFDGTNMILYVNGTAVTNVPSATNPTAANTANLQLGKDYGANIFTGNIDEARVYSRALTGGEISTLQQATFGQAPVTGLMATPGQAQITLTWTAAANATSYNIYQSTGGGPYVLIANTAALSYTDLSVTYPLSYSYEVTAVGALESAVAGPLTASPQAVAPHTNSGYQTHNFAHRCGCSSIPLAREGSVTLLGFTIALLVLRRRR